MGSQEASSQMTDNKKKEQFEDDKRYINNIIDRYNLKREGSYLTEFYTLALILKDCYEIGANDF